MTTADVIKYLRKAAHDLETIYYMYVVSSDLKLEGVITIRELLLEDDDTKVEEFMIKDIISVNVEDQEDDVARQIAKYNLIAIPVVDDNNEMKGIVTVDDAIDIILPTAWKKRIPKMFR